MGSYFGLFKMTFKGELQYRVKAISGVITQFFWGLMYIFLFTAFMSEKTINGFSVQQMTSYIWLGQAFFALKYIMLPKNCGKMIASGDVCYNLIRPMNFYNQWFMQGMGERLSSTLLRCTPLIIVTLCIPTLGLSLPVSLTAFGLFLVALIIGFFMASAISMIAVYLTFITLTERGMPGIINIITGLLCGTYIPLPLLPESVQNVIMYLPFRVIGDLPFRIYIGNIGTNDALIQIGIGLAWLFVMVLLGKLVIHSALKKTVVQGG